MRTGVLGRHARSRVPLAVPTTSAPTQDLAPRRPRRMRTSTVRTTVSAHWDRLSLCRDLLSLSRLFAAPSLVRVLLRSLAMAVNSARMRRRRANVTKRLAPPTLQCKCGLRGPHAQNHASPVHSDASAHALRRATVALPAHIRKRLKRATMDRAQSTVLLAPSPRGPRAPSHAAVVHSHVRARWWRTPVTGVTSAHTWRKHVSATATTIALLTACCLNILRGQRAQCLATWAHNIASVLLSPPRNTVARSALTRVRSGPATSTRAPPAVL